MAYEILTASKEHSEDVVRANLATAYPDSIIENIELKGDEWEIRLADVPPFLQDKEEAPASDDSEAPKEDGDEEKSEKSDDDKGEKKDKSEKGEGESGSSLDALKSLIDELQSKMTEIMDHATKVHQEGQEKQEKIDEISEAAGEHASPKGEKGLDDLPLPEEGAAPPPAPSPDAAAEAGPGAGGGIPPVPKAPGRPGAGAGRPKPVRPGSQPGGGIPTFTKRKTEVVTHDGVDPDSGERISLLAAASLIESDPEFAEYEVTGMTENRDGTYSAKLTLKS